MKHSKETCEHNYKKCGILDTLGNVMCVPENDECPINEIIVDSYNKKNEYISRGYKAITLYYLSTYYHIYYTNKAIDKEIITKLDFFEFPPKYITEDNFIFDEENKNMCFGLNSSDDSRYYDDDDDYDWDDDRLRNLDNDLYATEECTTAIKGHFESEENIDKSFKNVFKNLYVGNYIGFKDYSSMDKFMNIDLYYLYFHSFPDDGVIICCYFLLLPIFIITILPLIICCRRDPDDNCCCCNLIMYNIIITIIYLPIFIGFFIYIIDSYCEIYNKSNLGYITQIKADEFITDLIAEVKEKHQSILYHIIIIFLFSISMAIFPLTMIFNLIFNHVNKIVAEPVYERTWMNS